MRSIINFFKTLRNVRPRTGDAVVTYVGFGSRVEGIVGNVYPDYCWINQYYTDKDGNRKLYKSSTASFSYCQFFYI